MSLQKSSGISSRVFCRISSEYFSKIPFSIFGLQISLHKFLQKLLQKFLRRLFQKFLQIFHQESSRNHFYYCITIFFFQKFLPMSAKISILISLDFFAGILSEILAKNHIEISTEIPVEIPTVVTWEFSH